MTRSRILYIEDDPEQRKKLASLLTERGFEVVAETDGPSGLARFEKEKFDAVLCDLNIPGMDGFEVLKAARKINPDIPFLIMTGHGSIPLAVEAIKEGARHFMVKPVEVDEIEVKLNRSIEYARLTVTSARSDAIMQLLSETLPDIVYSLDTDGNFISISSAVENILGYKPDEILGRSMFDFLHPDDLENVKRNFLKNIETKNAELKTLEFRMIDRAGKTHHIEVRRRLVFKDGNIIRNDGVARDVSDRKQMEKSLKEANEKLMDKARKLENSTLELGRANVDLLTTQEKLQAKNEEMKELLRELSHSKDELQAILDSSNSSIVMVDNEGRIKAANSVLKDYFHIQPSEILDRRFTDFLEKIAGCFENPKNHDKLVKQLIDKPDGVIDESIYSRIEKRLVKLHHPKERFLAVFCTPVTNAEKNEIGRVWSYIDLTDYHHSQEQVKLIVETSPIPTIISGLDDGRVIYVNDRLAELIGLPKEKLIGQKTIDFYYDIEDRKRVVEALRTDGFIDNFEARLKNHQGDMFWGTLSLARSRLHDEDVIIGGLNDVTERKQTEANLARRLRYEKGLAELSRIMLEEQDMDTALNLSLKTLLDAARASRVYIFKNFEHPDDGLCMRRMYHAHDVDQIPNNDNTPAKHLPYKAGFKRWADMLARGEMINEEILDLPHSELKALEKLNILSILIIPINVEGSWYGFIGFDDCRRKRQDAEEDIRLLRTAAEMIGSYIEAKKFEEALRVSEERFRNLVENATDVIYSLDAEGNFTYISPQFTEATGLKVSDYIGKPVASVLHEDDSAGQRKWVEEGMPKDVDGEGAYLFRVKTRDGDHRWFTTNSSVIRNEKGEPVEAIGVAHDITLMKKVLEDLEQANRNLIDTQAKLVQSEKMASLGQLVAGIAHEINTPVGAINSMHNTLIRAVNKLKEALEKECPTEVREAGYIGKTLSIIEEANRVIQNGTERVTTIVRRLRSFARLDEADLKKVDIHEGLEDTLTLIHHEIKHNITVERNYGDLPPIACYPGRLNQVFLNLLNNARQAIKGKGIIGIKTYARDKKIYIEISDTGDGIPAEHLARVFDPGFTTKGVKIGTGLGLSICFQIIEDHKGEIFADSTVGKGTKFTIILPMNLDELVGNKAPNKK